MFDKYKGGKYGWMDVKTQIDVLAIAIVQFEVNFNAARTSLNR